MAQNQMKVESRPCKTLHVFNLCMCYAVSFCGFLPQKCNIQKLTSGQKKTHKTNASAQHYLLGIVVNVDPAVHHGVGNGLARALLADAARSSVRVVLDKAKEINYH